MKNFLSKLWSLSRTDRVRTLAIDAVSLPSFCRVNMLKLVSVLVILLTIGSGNVWADVTDEITASSLAATSTTYTDFSNVSITSDAKYAGNSAKNSSNIQLRSKNSNSGIVSTASGGKVKSVKITVASGSNTIDVYGSNTAYTSAADLYNTSKQGTKVGSVTSTETVTFSSDYAYVGIRSNSGAIYLSSVEITWSSSGGSSCDNCEYYVYDGSKYVKVGETGADDVVLTPPNLEGYSYYNPTTYGTWSIYPDITAQNGGACLTNYATKSSWFKYVPNPGGASPSDVNKPKGVCKLYAVYQNSSTNCLETAVGVPACARFVQPQDLTEVVDGSNVTLSWTEKSASAPTKYHLYVTNGLVDVFDGEVTGTSKTLSGLAAGDYMWSVYGVSTVDDQCDSDPNEDGEFTIVGCTDISSSTVTGVSVTPSKVGGSATWTAVANATSYEVKVYAGTATSGEALFIAEPTSNSCTITGLSASTQYTVVVKAKNSCSTSNQGTATWTTSALTLFTVTFVNQSGTAVSPATQTTEGGSVTLPSASPSAACAALGWTFAGWKDGSAQTETTSAPTLIAAGSYNPSGNKTFYAVYTMTESGGGTPKTTLLSSDFETDKEEDKWTHSTTYRETFDGSNTIRMGSGSYAGSITSTTLSAPVGTTITVACDLAVYSSDGTTVTIAVSGAGSESEDVSSYSTLTAVSKTFVTTTATFTVTISTPAKKKRCYVDNIEIYYGGGGSSTTYWNSNPSCSSEATVTYHNNGAKSGAAPTDANSPYTIGDNVTVLGTGTMVAPDGKEFKCWNTAADGTGTDYNIGAKFDIAGNMDFYPKWVNAPYTVTFDAEGGTCGTSSLTEASGGAGVTLPAATATCAPAGWSFYGWATSASTSTTSAPTIVGTTGATYYPTGNITLHAVYKEGGYAISSGSFTQVTGAANVVDGKFYLITNVNNAGGMMYNTVTSAPRIGSTTNSYASCDDINCAWQMKKNGDYWQIYSPNKGLYAAGTGVASRATLMSDGTDDKTMWTLETTGEGHYKFKNKYNTAQSVNAYLAYSDGNGYACMAANGSRDVLYLYKEDYGSIVAGTTTYNSNPTCVTYNITLNQTTGGTIYVNGTTDSPQESLADQKITLTSDVTSGYRFTNWSVYKTGDPGTTVSVTNSTSEDGAYFTMPAYGVTVEAVFTEIINYTITWKVNNANYSTYTGAGTLSTGAEGGVKWSTLTLPDAPADNTLSACDRTKFVGWSTSQLTGDGNSAPSDLFKTTSDANADSHTITGNTTFYAVFAKGGGEGSWGVSGSNITATSSGTGYAKYNGDHELSGIGYKTNQVMPSSTNLQFQASAGYLYNTTAMPSDITSIVLAVNTLNVYEGTAAITSTGGLTPLSPTGSGPYTYTFSSGKRYFHLKEPDSGASVTTVTVNYEGTGTDYVTSCACSWQINYITNGKKDGDGSAIWSTDNCFQQVGDTHEWQIEDFAMPNVAGQFWVGPGSYSGHSAIEDLSSIKYVLRNDKSRTSYSAVSNMIGTLNIWDNSGDNNYYPGIYPDYQITYGVEGGGSWTKVDFNYISGTTYETEVVTAPTYFAVANFKYYVGVKTDGNTGWGGKSSTVLMNTMSGMTSNQDGKHGKWRMYEDSGSDNWYCAWVPYYILSYDANGGTGAPSAETAVSSEGDALSRTKTVSSTVPTRDGYTFIGWNTAPGGDGTAKSAGDNIVLTSDVTLYAQWRQNFTVTYDLGGGSADPACAGGTYYVGETVDVCTSTPTRVSSSFLGWLVYKTGDKSTTVTVTAGQFTMPAYNVTVEAQWETVYFHIYYKEEDGTAIATDDVPQTAEATLRNQTPCVGYTFFGWSTSKITTETTTKPTGATFIGKGGASYTPTADITVYPVYARSEGATTVKDTLTVAINNKAAYNAFSGVSKDTEGVKIHSNAVYAGSTGNSNSSIQVRATDGVVTTSSGGILKHVHLEVYSSTAKTRNIYVYGKNTAYSTFAAGAFPTGDAQGTKIATAARNVDSQTSNQMFELPAADEEFADSYQYFAFNADGAAYLVNVIVTWGTGTYYYATHCETKENVTVTYNGNGGTVGCGSPADGAITSVTWDYKNSGADAPELASAQTICASATRSGGYILRDWTTSADGTGTHYTPGASITSLANDITLYAQWDRVYTVTFNDQGTTTPVTQATYGGTVAVPSATTPCIKDGVTWTFAGWGTVSPLSQSLAGHIIISSGTSTYTPTEDVTLYAVYSKALGTSDAFAVGTSGAYKISAKYSSGTKTCYASTKGGGLYNCSENAGDASTFYLNYVNSGTYAGKYTLQNSAGEYIGWSSSTTLSFSEETPAYYTVTQSGDGWLLSMDGVTGSPRYFTHESSTIAYNFKAYTEANPVYFTPAAAAYYYTTMSCDDDFSITFHENGGTITWNMPLHGEGTYQHLADGTEIDVFPTATFDGWTFLGWRAADYDESTTAPEPSTIYGGSDGESGNHFTIHSNTDMYPVFTRFEDNEPFDEVNGGDYFIYFLEEGSDDGYGDEKRVYAGEYSSDKRYNSTALCSAATTFTFTKLDNGNWTIYDNTTNKYLYGIENDDLKQQASATGAEWTLTVNGNQFDAFHVGTSYGQLQASGNGTSATFMNYRRTNVGTGDYHRVYLGSCTNRTFTTNPSTTPEIDLKGTAVVTASQNGAVRGTNVLTVSGHNLTPSTGTISITSNSGDIYFTTNTDDSFAEGMAAANQPKNTITVTANSSGIVVPTSLYVHYKPTGNTDGVTNVTVTATYSGATDATTTVKARRVKENFAIAAKVGDSWYALPANMGSSDTYAPTLIEVDESSNVAYGPSTVAYKLWPVKTTNGSGNRYAAAGDEVRFTGNSDNALWANNVASGTTTGIRNWAVVNSIDDGGSGSGEDKDERYEWVLSTEDGDAYTINTNQSNNKRNLVIYRKNGQLVWATNGTYVTNELHLIPLTERATITIIPREWKADGLVFSIDADNLVATSGTSKIGTGSETAATYTRRSTGGYGLYEVALPALASHYGKVLTLKMTINSVVTYAYVTIPIIVSGTTTTTTAATPFTTLGTASKDYDVVILEGAKLTTNATTDGAYKFQNFYVYSGATWINDNASTSLGYLELRGGIKGIDARDSHAQGVPHVLLKKSVSSTAGANLDMTVYTDHGYALSVPFDVDLSKVNFANSLKPGTGAQVNGTLASQFWIRKYDGEVRANNGRGGWVDITPADNKTIQAGEGYTLQGKRPKGQPFAVIRFPFTGVNSWADGSGEVEKADIPIYAYGGGANTPDNDKGWNLIANPYMATIAYNTEDELSWAASFKVGNLEKTDGANWDGKYQWKDASHAYVTIPNDSYTAFPQTRASKATFEPFKNFFIQTTSGGVVAFVRTDRSEIQQRLMAQEEQMAPIFADINLAHGSESAQAGLTIDAGATAGYKFGEDYTIFESREELDYLKVYTIADGHYLVGNTLTPAETTEMIPLEFYAPNTTGEYVFSLDEGSDIDRLEYVILYDAELGLNTNLLTGSYAVELDKTGLIENRFSIGLKIKEEEHVTTGTGDVDDEAERPFKFIHNDKMYILRNGKLYDATGKMVREINK